MAKKNTDFSSGDITKWFLVVFLLVAGLLANRYYHQLPMSLRLIGWIGILGISALIGLQTAHGRKFIGFAKESRIELQKVVWPAKEETVRTTFIVMLMVILISLLIWGVDSIIFNLVAFLTGQRG